MLACISQPDTSLAKKFAWLLREDLGKTFKKEGNPTFSDRHLFKAAKNTQLGPHISLNYQNKFSSQEAGRKIFDLINK